VAEAGLAIRRCSLPHINPDFVRHGPVEPIKLRDAIGRTGSIVAYNAAFELGRLKECCEAMPDSAAWLEGVANRVVDLLDPFKSFHYYHPGLL